MQKSYSISPGPLFALTFAAAALAFALGADRPEATRAATDAQDLSARKTAFEKDVRNLKSQGLAPDHLAMALAEART